MPDSVHVWPQNPIGLPNSWVRDSVLREAKSSSWGCPAKEQAEPGYEPRLLCLQCPYLKSHVVLAWCRPISWDSCLVWSWLLWADIEVTSLDNSAIFHCLRRRVARGRGWWSLGFLIYQDVPPPLFLPLPKSDKFLLIPTHGPPLPGSLPRYALLVMVHPLPKSSSIGGTRYLTILLCIVSATVYSFT